MSVNTLHKGDDDDDNNNNKGGQNYVRTGNVGHHF
jgi:hypothetical protein